MPLMAKPLLARMALTDQGADNFKTLPDAYEPMLSKLGSSNSPVDVEQRRNVANSLQIQRRNVNGMLDAHFLLHYKVHRKFCIFRQFAVENNNRDFSPQERNINATGALFRALNEVGRAARLTTEALGD